MDTVEFDQQELRILRAAMSAYVADFGHEEADVLRIAKRVLAKLPDEHLTQSQQGDYPIMAHS